MATPVTYTIGKTSAPESRDYSSISNFEADIGVGISADLVTDDEAWTVDCYEDTGTTITESPCTIDPTTDATRNITLKAATSHAFFDTLTSSSQLIDSVSNGVHFTMSSTFSFGITTPSNVDIDGLQFSSSGNAGAFFKNAAGGAGTISRCIAHGTATNTKEQIDISSSGDYSLNRVLVISNSATKDGIKVGISTKNIKRCTVVATNTSSGVGINRTSGTANIDQCAIFGFTTDTDAITGNYNASDGTGTPGANSVDSLTFTSQFENTASGASGDWRIKAGAGLLDVGTNSSLSTDIIGTSLPQNGTEDIGCWEYATAGDVTITPPTASLGLVGLAPTAAITNNKTINIPSGSLVLVGLLPAAIGEQHVSIDVPAGSPNLTGFIPVASASNHIIVSVPIATLTLSAYIPSISTSADTTISVPVANIDLTGLQPTILTHVTIDVPEASLSLIGQTPTVGNNQTINIPAGTLSIGGFAPEIQTTANITIDAPSGDLTVSGIAPVAAFTEHVSVDIPLGSLGLNGLIPSIDTGVIVVTPEGRVFVIAADSRVFEIPADDRVYTIQ